VNGRILIVGGGIAGLATAWWLARRGARDVVVVEAGDRLGARATSQNAAILRTPMPDPLGEELGREGADFLREPPSGFADRALLDPCGLLLVARRSSAGARIWAERLAHRPNADVRELDLAELRARAPHVDSADARAFLLPREGRIDVPALVRAFEMGARAAGVRFLLATRVRELRDDGRGVRLDDGRVLEAERTVLAAGAWAGPLAASAGSRVDLRPTRRHLVVTRASRAVDPRWPVVWRDDDPFYARPESGGLLLSGCDEEDVEPDRLAAQSSELERTRVLARRHLRLDDEFAFEPARFWAGIRTHAEDQRFVVGPDPDVAGLLWAGALGGHGITCAGPVGAIAADWILDGASTHRFAHELDPRRFTPRIPNERADEMRSIQL